VLKYLLFCFNVYADMAELAVFCRALQVADKARHKRRSGRFCAKRGKQTKSGTARVTRNARRYKLCRFVFKINIVCGYGGIGRRAWFCSRHIGEKLLNSVYPFSYLRIKHFCSSSGLPLPCKNYEVII